MTTEEDLLRRLLDFHRDMLEQQRRANHTLHLLTALVIGWIVCSLLLPRLL